MWVYPLQCCQLLQSIKLATLMVQSYLQPNMYPFSMNTYMYLFVFTVLAAGPKYVRAPHQGSIRVSTALKCSSNSKHVRMFLGPNVAVNNNVIYWHARQIISSIFFLFGGFFNIFPVNPFPTKRNDCAFLSLLWSWN